MRALLMLLALSSVACAPTLTQLVDDKHYREAICGAVDDGHEDEVAAALTEDANLHLHVHRVTAEELAPVLGPDAVTRVDKKAQFVRVRMQSNAIPVDGYGVRIAFDGAPSSPVSWKSLAFATGEQLPPKVRGRTYATLENVGIGTAAVFTVGMSLLFTGGFKPGTRLYNAPRSDYLSWAPHATALHDEMARPTACTSLGTGTHQQKRCDLFFVVDSTPDAAWSLHVDQAFAANRLTMGRDDICRVEANAVVPIGDLRKPFGSKMARLTEIAQPH